MPNEKKQVGTKTSGVKAQLFFWPGQNDLANHLADELAAPKPLAFDPTAVTAALRNQSSVVVLWRGPDADVAPCLTSGDPIAEALEDWKDKARDLAVLYRKNRRVMILAEGEALRSAGTEALAERLGLTSAPSLPQIQPPLPLGLALTHLALDQDEDLRVLVDELVSSSLPVPDPVMADVLTLAVAQVAQSSRNLSTLEDERDAADRLRLQLEADIAEGKTREEQHRAQIDQLEARMTAEAAAARAEAEAAATAAADKIGALESQISLQEDAITTLSSDAAALRASRDEQTAAAQAAAKRATDYIRSLEAQISQHEAKIATLASEADAVRTTLEAKGTEADMLRGQLALNQTALDDQTKTAADLAVQLKAVGHELTQKVAGAATLTAETKALTARLAESDAEAEILRSQLALNQSALDDQTETAADLALHLKAMEDALTHKVAEAAALTESLAARDSEADLLRGQIFLNHAALQQQTEAAARVLQDSTAQIEALQAKLSDQDAIFKEWLEESEAQVEILRTQLALNQSLLIEQSTSAQVALAQTTAAAETALAATSQRISTLEDQLAKQEKKASRLMAEGLAISARLTEREAESGIRIGQLQRGQSDLLLQIKALEDQIASQTLAAAAVETRLSAADQKTADLAAALEQERAALQQALAQGAKAAAEEAERARRDDLGRAELALAEERAKQRTLAAELADKAAEIDVLSRQVQVLQEGLAQVVTETADRPVVGAGAHASGASGELMPRTEAWDRALAKALSAARSEAELRAKLEQDLEAVTSRLNLRIQREADLGFNEKLFAKMTVEATASLDEIARLSAAAIGARAPSDA